MLWIFSLNKAKPDYLGTIRASQIPDSSVGRARKLAAVLAKFKMAAKLSTVRVSDKKIENHSIFDDVPNVLIIILFPVVL